MKGCEFSPEALADLQEIWAYIASDNPVAADRLEADIYQACALLAKNPRLGHKRPDLTDEPVLFWTVRHHYLVIYHGKKQLLQILDLSLHGSPAFILVWVLDTMLADRMGATHRRWWWIAVPFAFLVSVQVPMLPALASTPLLPSGKPGAVPPLPSPPQM